MKQTNVVGIILPILQMEKLGLREVQKPVQDGTARNQQSQVGNPRLPLPGMCFVTGQVTTRPSAGGPLETPGYPSATW